MHIFLETATETRQLLSYFSKRASKVQLFVFSLSSDMETWRLGWSGIAFDITGVSIRSSCHGTLFCNVIVVAALASVSSLHRPFLLRPPSFKSSAINNLLAIQTILALIWM